MLTSAFGGPERIDSKDKMVMAPPACDPRWYVSLGGSVDFPFGDFSDGVNADINGEATLDVLPRDWNDAYSDFWNIKGEVGYVLTGHIELFGTFQYTHGESKVVTGSSLDFGGPTLFFESQYGDYNSYGGELGLRYFFTDKESRIRPYVSVAGGATFVNSIGLHADAPGLALERPGDTTVYDGAFYDDSVVGTVTALLGVEFQVIPCKFSVGIDAGIHWQSQLEGDDSAFDTFANNIATSAAATSALSGKTSSGFQSDLTAALSKINDSGEHFSVPVTVYAKFRF
jgi:hypothetical protein